MTRATGKTAAGTGGIPADNAVSDCRTAVFVGADAAATTRHGVAYYSTVGDNRAAVLTEYATTRCLPPIISSYSVIAYGTVVNYRVAVFHTADSTAGAGNTVSSRTRALSSRVAGYDAGSDGGTASVCA